MSDLATETQLAASSAQLPVNWYFERPIYELEQKLLFGNGPGYIGHELMVPNAGDYHTLGWMGDAKTLVRNRDGIELLSNVCRHRQAIMLEGRGHTKNIVCPIHRWTYDLKGELLGAPEFPSNPCLHLPQTALQNWREQRRLHDNNPKLNGTPMPQPPAGQGFSDVQLKKAADVLVSKLKKE